MDFYLRWLKLKNKFYLLGTVNDPNCLGNCNIFGNFSIFGLILDHLFFFRVQRDCKLEIKIVFGNSSFDFESRIRVSISSVRVCNPKRKIRRLEKL